MIINITKLKTDDERELIQGERLKFELGLLEQCRVAEANKQIERSYMDGIGSLRASFTRNTFYALELHMGRGWWRDRKELAKFLKENPQFAVTAKFRHTTVRVDGFRDRRNCGRPGSGGHVATGDPAQPYPSRVKPEPAPTDRSGRRFLGHETAKVPRSAAIAGDRIARAPAAQSFPDVCRTGAVQTGLAVSC